MKKKLIKPSLFIPDEDFIKLSPEQKALVRKAEHNFNYKKQKKDGYTKTGGTSEE